VESVRPISNEGVGGDFTIIARVIFEGNENSEFCGLPFKV
jgi:hypothetical protein